MSARCVSFRTFPASVVIAALAATSVLAQGTSGPHPTHQQQPPVKPPDAEHQHPPSAPDSQQHQHHGPTALALFPTREASGTSWLPDETPMYGVHGQVGAWQLMGHGNLFAQFLYESGDRGRDQFGSINWVMGMARRDAGGGRFGVRGMLSFEPLTIAGCGYPDLLATGEVCDGQTIHDEQHPHDLPMELAVEYERPMAGSLRWHVYGGLAGEPALGPVAYPHRLSAMPNPLAPISHHWLDATHITFGVVTAGVSGARWRAEASAFNGREPDEDRWGLDLAALDSYSGRLWFLPSPSLALQVSAGHLREAEAAHTEGPRVDVDRVTASATYHRSLKEASVWASTVAWGRNTEDGVATNALLLETNLTFDERDTWFGRFELAGKAAHDLDIHESERIFTVGKLQAGYTRYFDARRGLKPGIGGSISAGFVPSGLEAAYGRRVNVGFGVFVTLRPG
jgi:hypothetical protein